MSFFLLSYILCLILQTVCKQENCARKNVTVIEEQICDVGFELLLLNQFLRVQAKLEM